MTWRAVSGRPHPHLAAAVSPAQPYNRGLHTFTFQLNVSAFYGIGGLFGGCLWGVSGVLAGIRGWSGCVFVSETAQVELKSGRVQDLP